MSCPVCHKPSHKTFTPFCSKTCKNIDLIRWFREDYRIPTHEPIEEGSTEVQKESSQED